MKKADIPVILPAIFVLALTAIIAHLTGYPRGLFFGRSTGDISTRFLIITFMLLIPLPTLPKFLTCLSNAAVKSGLLGQLVIDAARSYGELNKSTTTLLRPLQGIGLSLLFAERLLQLIQFSTGTSYSRLVVPLILFLFGNILVSLLLSTIWAFDDLGVKMYSRKTGEVRLFGGSVGVILPLLTGVVGITTLFQYDTATGVLVDLLGISMILYPPYVIFALVHHEYFRRRGIGLLQRLSLKKIETKIWSLDIADKSPQLQP